MLEERINADIKQAMLNKEKDMLESLRAIKAALLLLKTGKGDVNDAAELSALQKLVKQRKEAAEIFNQQNRSDLAESELLQASIIERYLPKQMSRDEIEASVKAIISELGATSAKDMGRVMGTVSKKFAGTADNKVVAEIVKSMLG